MDSNFVFYPSNAFAPGAKVNMQGDDYLCDNCLPGSPKDQPSPGAEGGGDNLCLLRHQFKKIIF